MKRVGTFVTGIVVGATLFGDTAAYAAGIMAEQSMNRFLVDGQEVQLDAYAMFTGIRSRIASKSKVMHRTPVSLQQPTMWRLPRWQTMNRAKSSQLHR